MRSETLEWESRSGNLGRLLQCKLIHSSHHFVIYLFRIVIKWLIKAYTVEIQPKSMRYYICYRKKKGLCTNHIKKIHLKPGWNRLKPGWILFIDRINNCHQYAHNVTFIFVDILSTFRIFWNELLNSFQNWLKSKIEELFTLLRKI